MPIQLIVEYEKSPENKVENVACDQDRMPISAFQTKIYFELLLLRYFSISDVIVNVWIF